MKILNKLSLVGAAIAAALLLSSPAHAQFLPSENVGESVNGYMTAVSTEVPVLVRYTGSSESGLVAVDAATGDLTFTSGTAGAEATDATLECPVSGALGGVIDVSNAACNTMGEVCDIINGSTSGAWTCVLLDALRADSSDNTLITLAATSANRPDGLGLLADGTVSFTATKALTTKTRISDYINGRDFGLNPTPFQGLQSKFVWGTATTTYGSGTSTLQIISCDINASRTAGRSNETCTVLASKASGATTVAGTWTEFAPYGLYGKKDQKLLFRVLNSAALTAATMSSYGIQWDYRNRPQR